MALIEKYLYGIGTDLYKEVSGVLVKLSGVTIPSESNFVTDGSDTVNATVLASNNYITLYKYTNNVNVTGANMNYILVYKGQTVIQNFDFPIPTITTGSLLSTVPANGKLLILVSKDSGATWQTFSSNIFINSSLANIKTEGFTAALFNGVTQAQWQSYLGISTKLRFAYYFEQATSTDKVLLDKIRINYNLPQ